MKNNFETKFTGWALIVAAVFLIIGKELSPHQLGEYFVSTDWSTIGENIWTWIWMYRVYIFGWVIMGLGMMGLATITFSTPARILMTPGLGIIVIGTFITALTAAFYYTYGAYGVGKTANMTAAELQIYTNDIFNINHYITCLVRFGRIFSGVGFVLVGFGLYKFKLMDSWLGIFTILIGLTSVCVILFIHDNFEVFKPVYYVKILWLLVVGATILRKGINLPENVS